MHYYTLNDPIDNMYVHKCNHTLYTHMHARACTHTHTHTHTRTHTHTHTHVHTPLQILTSAFLLAPIWKRNLSTSIQASLVAICTGVRPYKNKNSIQFVMS